MPPVTRRPAGRTPPARSAGSRTPARPPARRGGVSVLDRIDEEQTKQTARKEARQATFGAPRRFFVMPGESREIVIVDEGLSFARHEHALKNRETNRYDLFVPCLDEHCNCPACADHPDSRAYFAVYLTILDLTPYETADGTQVEWSKKLLVAKPTQQKKLARLFNQHGTLRGMVLQVTRDGEKDAAIGNDIEFIEFMPEEELLEYETTYTDRDKKVHEIIGHEPVDYEDVFPEMSEEQVAAISSGGRMRTDDSAAARRKPGATSSRRATPAEPADEWEEEGEAQAPRGRRGAVAPAARGRTAPPARSTARRAPEPAAEEGYEEGDPPSEEVEDEVIVRPRAGVRTAATRAAVTPPAEDEYEEEDEADPPQRSSVRRGGTAPAAKPPQSLADRRRSLRR